MTAIETPTVRSGHLSLRLPVDLHEALAVEAARQGVSMNSLIVALLAGAVCYRATSPSPRRLPD
jgi:predicted HicB family RNase H-like nuclease